MRSNGSEKFQFCNFVELPNQKLDEILSWRNHPEIRKWMYNSELISLEEHLSFCRSLRDRTDCAYWLVTRLGFDLGVINITDINQKENSAEWGFYLKPDLFRSGMGFELFGIAQFFFFKILNIGILKGKVRVDNKAAIMMNDFFGMKHLHNERINGVTYSYREQRLQEWDENNWDFNSLNKRVIEYFRKTTTTTMHGKI